MIELEQARGLLARAVLTMGPDFLYVKTGTFKNCYYRPMTGDEYDFQYNDPRNETGCLIGVALSLAGETRHLNLQTTVNDLSIHFPSMMSVETIKYFHIAQKAQDSGEPWGQAYKKAEESLKKD